MTKRLIGYLGVSLWTIGLAASEVPPQELPAFDPNPSMIQTDSEHSGSVQRVILPSNAPEEIIESMTAEQRDRYLARLAEESMPDECSFCDVFRRLCQAVRQFSQCLFGRRPQQ